MEEEVVYHVAVKVKKKLDGRFDSFYYETILEGYATGDPKTIKEYYSDNANHEVSVFPMCIRTILREDADERKNNLEEKARIEQRLCELEKALGWKTK